MRSAQLTPFLTKFRSSVAARSMSGRAARNGASPAFLSCPARLARRAKAARLTNSSLALEDGVARFPRLVEHRQGQRGPAALLDQEDRSDGFTRVPGLVEARYIAPDLLPRFEAVASRLHAWNEEPGTPTLRLEYRFFHPAVIRGLMSEIGWRAGDLAEYWKYGFWFKDGRRETQLLLQLVDTSSDDVPGAGALELKAQGRDPLGLLREMRQAVLRQRIGGEPERELLTLEGTTVARGALDSVIDSRVLDLQKKPVAAAAFSAFFEDREHDSAEDRAIDINPQPLTASEKPREVFISYAWGDETPAGQIRAKAVDGLASALEKDGFLPVRDRDQMRPGERISAFIRRLTRADLVRLVREFAHHVDGILVFLQDVLMPRKLEAHLDDGFEAVREALRRRIERTERER